MEDTMNLTERMKNWPMLATHRLDEVEAVLLSFEERLTALEPKKAETFAKSETFAGKSIFAPPVQSSSPTIFAPAKT